MGILQITLLGHVSVIHPNGSAWLKLSHHSQALLAYLLLQPHPVAREVLMEAFWAGAQPDRARSNLTTAVWRLRQSLEPDGVRPGTYLITHCTGEVGFNWESPHWLDTRLFEEKTLPLLRKPMTALSEADGKHLEDALSLYQGELLEGMYEDWALSARERFRMLHLNTLSRLMGFYAARDDFEPSIAYALELLRHDPLREETHRELMRIYHKSGQRALAIRQYSQCRDLLRRELDVPPLEETQALYRQISMPSVGDSAEQEPPGHQEITRLTQELQRVQRSLDETSRILAQITQSFNRVLGGGLPGGMNQQKGAGGRK